MSAYQINTHEGHTFIVFAPTATLAKAHLLRIWDEDSVIEVQQLPKDRAFSLRMNYDCDLDEVLGLSEYDEFGLQVLGSLELNLEAWEKGLGDGVFAMQAHPVEGTWWHRFAWSASRTQLDGRADIPTAKSNLVQLHLN